MSDDESITTEDMNEYINEETFEEVEVKGIERKTHTKKVPKVKTEQVPKKEEEPIEVPYKGLKKDVLGSLIE